MSNIPREGINHRGTTYMDGAFRPINYYCINIGELVRK